MRLNHGYDIVHLGKFADFEAKKRILKDGKAYLVPDAQVRYDIVTNVDLPKEKLHHFKEEKKVSTNFGGMS